MSLKVESSMLRRVRPRLPVQFSFAPAAAAGTRLCLLETIGQ
jgi:hypothetical protein